MGGGESRYVQDQERFVNNNIDNYKKALPDYYSNSQIKGKLRQLYAKSDSCQRNKNSYIVDCEWSKVKNKVTPVYSSLDEKNGYRRYN